MDKIIILFLFSIIYAGFVNAGTGDDVKNLLTKLFVTDTYNKNIRPITNQSDILVVQAEFYLTAIIDFDEQAEYLTTSGYLALYWNDNYLAWNPATYNGIEYLQIPQNDIWKPDVALRNTYKSFTGLGSTFLNIRVYFDGSADWRPFQVFQSTCSVDIKYFPFDKQVCELKFIAWSYEKNEVEINQGTNGIMLDEFSDNSQWDLVETAGFETESAEAGVLYTITLKRKPLYYTINIIIPVMLLTILNVFNFVLPISSGERAGYSITVFLSLAVFLTIIASELPKNSDSVSLLAIYLTMMTSVSTIIVGFSLIQQRIHARNDDSQPPGRGYLFIHKVYRVFRCKCKKKVSHTESISDLKVIEKKRNVEEPVMWVDIVTAMDFLCFWFCITFTFVCTLVIFITAARG